MKLIATTALALGAGFAVSAAAPVQSEGIEIGAKPKFEFRNSILNGKGIKTLADLKGKPTLIDFWGTR